MAYFANGTEGMILDEQCGECPVANDAPCPILLVQLNYNYKQCRNKELEDAMNILISKEGQCEMKPIIENNLVDKRQEELF